MVTITKRLEFDAGHRLLKHEGKCRSVHGHRYAVELTCTAPDLDEVGRVVDFGVIKEKVGGWIDDHLDHGFIAQEGDPIIEAISNLSSKMFVIDVPPTAENLAKLAFQQANVLLAETGVKVIHVSCWETPTSRAGFSEQMAMGKAKTVNLPKESRDS